MARAIYKYNAHTNQNKAEYPDGYRVDGIRNKTIDDNKNKSGCDKCIKTLDPEQAR